MTPSLPSRQALSRKLSVLNCFDPWSSPLCTCGPKLSLDPYTGCPGECAYCYAATYLWRYWGRDRVQPKRNLLTRLRRDLRRIAAGDDPDLARLQGAWVTVSNSSDPYPEVPRADERELGLTREALVLLAEAGMGVLLQTKSDLFTRDLDVLPLRRTVVGVTITTLDAALASRLEPGMPAPERRLAAIATTAAAGLPALVRIDPLVPGLNTDPEALQQLVQAAAQAGARHVVSSTLKLQPGSRQRLAAAFPQLGPSLSLYTESQGRGGYRQLPLPARRTLLQGLREMVLAAGLSFGVCREAELTGLSTTSCDGRHLATDS
jgi:DNA repair photolyase